MSKTITSFSMTLLLFIFSLSTSIFAQSSGLSQYVYDANGRLQMVVSPNGEAAIYTYDATGNIVSITRQNANILSVLGVNPESAGVGGTVTIYGRGFSVVAIQNTVKFNGVTATVVSATLTQIVTTVPVGATTGTVTVTTPTGTASSAQPFTVLEPVTISDFFPKAGKIGRAITINGSGISTLIGGNRVRFNGALAEVVSSSPTTITARVPSQAKIGPISLQTNGNPVESSEDFIQVPIDSFLATDAVEKTGRIAFGQTKIASVSTNKQLWLSFDAVAGQRVSLITEIGAALYDPNFTRIGHSSTNSNGYFKGIDATTATVSGKYVLIFFNGFGATTGFTNEPITLYNVPPDATATATLNGATVSLPITVPGQNAKVNFSGITGQKVNAVIGNTGNFGIDYKISLRKQDGSLVADIPATPNGFPYFALPLPALPENGNYSLCLDVAGDGTANLEVKLMDVTNEITQNIDTSGQPITITTTAPNQKIRLFFNGFIDQGISLQVTGGTLTHRNVSILAPDGSTIVSQNQQPGSIRFIDKQTLTTFGLHSILITPQSGQSGNITIRLYNVVDSKGTIVGDGTPAGIYLQVPGTNVHLAFAGIAGQRIYVEASQGYLTGPDVPTPSFTMRLLKPAGTQLNQVVGGSEAILDSLQLPVSGTYTIVIDPLLDATGDQLVRLYQFADDITGTITANGQPVTVSTSIVGQNARLTFTGVSGERVSLSSTTGGILSGNYSVSLLKPDGGVQVSYNGYGTQPPLQTLPSSGNYTLFIDPIGNAVGSTTLSLLEIGPDVTGAIAIDGAPVTSSNSTPFQDTRLTFSGTAGQKINLRFDVVGSTVPHSMKVLAPDGNILSFDQFSLPSILREQLTLPVTGAYTVLIDYYLDTLGIVRTQLFTSPSEIVGVVTVDDPAQTVTTTVPGQTVRLTFTGVAAQSLKFQFNSSSVTDFIFSVFSPDGSQLLPASFLSNATEILLPPLPANGTYTVIIDPDHVQVGEMAVVLTTVTTTAGGTLTIGGPDVVLTGGGIKDLTFNGIAGQPLALKVQPASVGGAIAAPIELGSRSTRLTRGDDSRVTSRTQDTQRRTTRVMTEASGGPISGVNLRIERPDGTLVMPEVFFESGEYGYLSLPPLTMTGTYHVKVSDPSGTPLNEKLGLYALPPTTQQLTAAVPAKTISVGAQPTWLYFNQALLTDNSIYSYTSQVVITNNTAGQVKVEILAPDGTVLDSMISNASTFTTSPQFLNSRDVKIIRVTATGSNVGNLTVSVTEAIIGTPRREPGTGKGNN